MEVDLGTQGQIWGQAQGILLRRGRRDCRSQRGQGTFKTQLPKGFLFLPFCLWDVFVLEAYLFVSIRLLTCSVFYQATLESIFTHYKNAFLYSTQTSQDRPASASIINIPQSLVGQGILFLSHNTGPLPIGRVGQYRFHLDTVSVVIKAEEMSCESPFPLTFPLPNQTVNVTNLKWGRSTEVQPLCICRKEGIKMLINDHNNDHTNQNGEMERTPD